MKYLLDELSKIGVKKIISCPGGRSKPLIDLFEDDKRFSIQSFFDERSASFYALGLASLREPVVVLTTSGSAVAECLPAVIEAKYQNNLPLIILSADRPEELRYTGSPQTIPQQNIFNDFISTKFDIKNIEKISLETITYPAQINICIDEPNPIKNFDRKYDLDSFVIVSQLKDEDSLKVKSLLKNYNGVIILEALSNFKEKDFSTEAVVVRLPDQFFDQVGLKSFKKSIRLGSVPVLKTFREIDHIDSYFLSGYLKGSSNSIEESFSSLNNLLMTEENLKDLKSIRLLNKSLNEKNKELISKYKNSEVSMISKIIEEIPNKALVFVGNSLPIREIQHSRFDKGFKVKGQRGVNGIDGSLSFALGSGEASIAEETWIILGDLTCLYDLQGFWPLLFDKQKKVRIVVINNNGGQIFKKIFNKDSMLNSHDLDFSNLAKFWQIEYSTNFKNFKSLKTLIEIKPDNNDSEKFWEEMKE